MRRFFVPLDDALFDRLFQPLTALLRYRFGLPRRRVARICVDVATAAWVLARGCGVSRALTENDVTMIRAKSAVLLMGLGALVSLRLLLARAPDGTANPLRSTMQPYRAVILLLLSAHLLQPVAPLQRDILDIVMLLCTTAALYLAACAEAPPPRRRALDGLATLGL